LPCAEGLPCASVCSTRQSHTFVVCWAFTVCVLAWHTAKRRFAVCQPFAVCCFSWHTAKGRFAVCPCLRTPANVLTHGNLEFPVAQVLQSNKISLCMVSSSWGDIHVLIFTHDRDASVCVQNRSFRLLHKKREREKLPRFPAASCA